MNKALLFVVEEVFVISGRGVVLAPGISNVAQLKRGDTVELLKPDGSCTRHIIKSVETMNYQFDIPVEKQTHPIILDFNAVDVPQGTEVWFISM